MSASSVRENIFRIIFGTDTPAGRRFDLALIWIILISVLVVMLESIEAVRSRHQSLLDALEWGFTLIFTFEYLLRIYCHPVSRRYVFSFYGLIDLVSILPTYLALLFGGAQYLLVVRLLRVMRIFRVLKLIEYVNEASMLWRSILASRRKILVFFCFVFVLATIFGSLMFLVESPHNPGFSSIPRSVYWTIVTITTVGFGDIVPITVLGQMVATLAILTGYSIIAVPTGIITSQLIDELRSERLMQLCENCGEQEHLKDANYCRRCGHALPVIEEVNRID